MGILSDSEQISSILYNIRPDEIYHLGAQSHVRVSFDTPEYTGNCDRYRDDPDPRSCQKEQSNILNFTRHRAVNCSVRHARPRMRRHISSHEVPMHVQNCTPTG